MVLPAILAAVVGPALPLAQDGEPDLADLLERLRALEELVGAEAGPGSRPAEPRGVDLGGDEYGSLAEVEGAPAAAVQIGARPWTDRVRLSGHVAAGYLDTGNAGTKPDGGFEVGEAQLFVEAQTWEDTSVFVELRHVVRGRDDNPPDLTGEVYVHFRHLAGDGVDRDLGLKLGRVDVPFGEEYLWRDAPDNPLITPSAPFPYGLDEGVLAYGRTSGLHWVGAVMDGSLSRSVDGSPGVAVAGKVGGRPLDDLALSASAIANGDATITAFQFGGSYIYPVGWMMPSTLGASASEVVESRFWQVDAVWTPHPNVELTAFAGTGVVDDDDDTFDRDLEWAMLQPLVHLGSDLHLVLRWSHIGSARSGEGFGFEGKPVSQGKADFGYDAEGLTRLSAGIGWRPNPSALVKLEVGRDHYSLIDASPFDPRNDDRDFIGLEVVLSF